MIHPRSTSDSKPTASRALALAPLLASRPARGKAPCGLVRRILWNLRSGRAQKLLAAATAASAPPLAFEIYLEHYKGSFGDKWMWTPVVLTPPLTAAGIGALFSERVAKTWLPLFAGLYAIDGLIGVVTHFRGVRKRPGGLGEPTYNLVMGPPLLAPGSLTMVGTFGLLAPLLGRER